MCGFVKEDIRRSCWPRWIF
ncbi:hypothetical protein Ocin01_14237 [Orchesella cincta]|uniref:Uncharacterized protein n=1 Tax=Orchesella cincta TaxID=48709 RepID=A0A1D2MHJ4_ORCCI|nr:hypothetical protein Ocin01_14237 [Orchesella cincta]